MYTSRAILALAFLAVVGFSSGAHAAVLSFTAVLSSVARSLIHLCPLMPRNPPSDEKSSPGLRVSEALFIEPLSINAHVGWMNPPMPIEK